MRICRILKGKKTGALVERSLCDESNPTSINLTILLAVDVVFGIMSLLLMIIQQRLTWLVQINCVHLLSLIAILNAVSDTAVLDIYNWLDFYDGRINDYLQIVWGPFIFFLSLSLFDFSEYA